MPYKEYGVIAKQSAEGYIYILKQFLHTDKKSYGVHFFCDPKELDVVYHANYEKAKRITEAEARALQANHRIGLLEEGKRTRKRSSKALDAVKGKANRHTTKSTSDASTERSHCKKRKGTHHFIRSPKSMTITEAMKSPKLIITNLLADIIPSMSEEANADIWSSETELDK